MLENGPCWSASKARISLEWPLLFPPIGTGQVSYANGQIQTNGSPDIDWNSQARRSFQSFLVQGSSQPKHSTTITCIYTNQYVMSITKGESNLQAYCWWPKCSLAIMQGQNVEFRKSGSVIVFWDVSPIKIHPIKPIFGSGVSREPY